jgi:hypothetical protein
VQPRIHLIGRQDAFRHAPVDLIVGPEAQISEGDLARMTSFDPERLHCGRAAPPKLSASQRRPATDARIWVPRSVSRRPSAVYRHRRVNPAIASKGTRRAVGQ